MVRVNPAVVMHSSADNAIANEAELISLVERGGDIKSFLKQHPDVPRKKALSIAVEENRVGAIEDLVKDSPIALDATEILNRAVTLNRVFGVDILLAAKNITLDLAAAKRIAHQCGRVVIMDALDAAISKGLGGQSNNRQTLSPPLAIGSHGSSDDQKASEAAELLLRRKASRDRARALTAHSDSASSQARQVTNFTSDASVEMSGETISSVQLSTARNSINDDVNYEFVRGNPDHGMIVLLPQTHLIGEDLNRPSNRRSLKEVFASQVDIFKELKKHKAEHIFFESLNPDIANLVNSSSSTNTVPTKLLEQFEEIVSLIEKDQHHDDMLERLDDSQKGLFLQIGGGMFYALLSQKYGLSAKVHATSTIEDTTKIKEITKDRNYVDELTPDEKNFIFTAREKMVERHILQARDELGGKPAWVIFGRDHDFNELFSTPDSPAFYRKIK